MPSGKTRRTIRAGSPWYEYCSTFVHVFIFSQPLFEGPHPFMNRIYRVIWNAAHNSPQVVSELASVGGKSSGSAVQGVSPMHRKRPALRALTLAVSLAVSLLALPTAWATTISTVTGTSGTTGTSGANTTGSTGGNGGSGGVGAGGYTTSGSGSYQVNSGTVVTGGSGGAGGNGGYGSSFGGSGGVGGVGGSGASEL